MNKVFFISTWGAGTPDYLIVAPDADTAFKMATKSWQEKYNTSRGIGSNYNFNTGKYTEPQTVAHIKDTGITTSDSPVIMDLNELK